MVDGGRQDEKILAIPFSDPSYHSYTDISQLPSHIFQEMSHFFAVYKELENKQTAVKETSGREDAVRIIRSAIENYARHYCP